MMLAGEKLRALVRVQRIGFSLIAAPNVSPAEARMGFLIDLSGPVHERDGKPCIVCRDLTETVTPVCVSRLR